MIAEEHGYGPGGHETRRNAVPDLADLQNMEGRDFAAEARRRKAVQGKTVKKE